MKLKSLAALIFRLVGALFILSCIQTLAVVNTQTFMVSMVEIIICICIGYCLIKYSKRLAALFCRGLDDDDVA